MRDEYRQVFDTGETLITEETVRIGDATIATETRKIPISHDGQVVQVVTVVRDITDRHRAERALRESEAKYRDLVEQMNDVVFRTDRDGVFTYVSPSVETHTGYGVLQVIGEHFARFAHPDDVQLIVDGGQSALEGRSTPFECRLCAKDGQVRWMRASCSPVVAGGTVVGVQGVMVDITQRKRAEERLRFQAQLLDSVREAVVATDLRGRVVYWGKGAESLYGYGAEEMLGHLVGAIVGPNDGEDEEARLRQVLRTGSWSGRHVQRRKDGSTFWADVFISLVTDGQGNPQGYIGIDRDITERVRTLQSLSESETKFRTLADQSPNMIFINCQGRVVYANRRSEEVMGYSAETLLSPNFDFMVLIAPEDRDAVRAKFARHLRGEDIEPYDYGLITADGRRLEAVITTKLIDYEGRRALLGIVTDVTELKRLEERLRTAEKMEAIGQLAGGIAHDFNNLLTVINGYCEYLLEDLGVSHGSREDVVAISQAGHRAADLTRQLLAFSRRQVRDVRVMDLNAALVGMRVMLTRVLGEDILLHLDPCPEGTLVEADEGQITQVLLNLVSNARDAMPTGGSLMIETATAQLDKGFTASHLRGGPGRHVVLAIHDTGCGMAPDVLHHLFEPFFTTKGRGRGTGLGLASVYGILSQADGHIDVESRSGEGTTFRVYFPCAASGIVDTKRPPPTAGAQSCTATVLVVEDEDRVRDFVCRVLVETGYRALAAADPGEALRIWEAQGPVDLVLTDVVMPQMNGPALISRLGEKGVDCRVIYMSGYPEDALARYGVTDLSAILLRKPFARDALLERVAAILRGD